MRLLIILDVTELNIYYKEVNLNFRNILLSKFNYLIFGLNIFFKLTNNYLNNIELDYF